MSDHIVAISIEYLMKFIHDKTPQQGDKTPFCGHPLDMEISKKLAPIILLSSLELSHLCVKWVQPHFLGG
jgi:hypothetical protein